MTKEEKDAAKAAQKAAKAAEKAAAKAAQKAAKAAEKAAAKAADTVEGADGIDVGDPMLLRPVELPLVVKPSNGGEWKNPEQAAYAKVVNAYAYKNPKKWNNNQLSPLTGFEIPNSSKKHILLKRLVEIGNNPSKLHELAGGTGADGLQYNNKALG